MSLHGIMILHMVIYRAAFLAGFAALASTFLLILNEPEAPVPLVWTRVPLVTRLLMAVLTRALFLSTSYPPAARAFLRAANDTPLRSLEAATVFTISSLTLGPLFLGLEAFFLAALAGAAAGAGAGATSAIFFLSFLPSFLPCWRYNESRSVEMRKPEQQAALKHTMRTVETQPCPRLLCATRTASVCVFSAA
ncbi:hypothetical protein GOODEAATRI_021725 [Goodea atripinnis]|uniref:NADH dehydrogenase subunit 2 n=1 Tax=Goodea atripinnis TaxID=208336 RepID=A0ABV0NM85_9TELE